MIALLRGIILPLDHQSVIVDTGPVGYEVFVPDTLRDLHGYEEKKVTLHVVTQVREDAFSLYGFESLDERALFLQLVTVKGVGPRMALAAISTLSPENLRGAIVGGREKELCTVSGIGKRTAQRIILELKDKVSSQGAPGESISSSRAPASTGIWHDLTLALINLGYASRQIDEAVAVLRDRFTEDNDLQTLLIHALRLLRSGER